jgi:pilus assembly protein Flp/PilA
MNQFLNAVRSFALEEDGAQVIEYALIIALVIALKALTANNGGFSNFINRVTTCLSSNSCT